jgi:hypothetical protein
MPDVQNVEAPVRKDQTLSALAQLRAHNSGLIPHQNLLIVHWLYRKIYHAGLVNGKWRMVNRIKPVVSNSAFTIYRSPFTIHHL